jgi:ribosomal protein S18 acetylase RimI-like enzyme
MPMHVRDATSAEIAAWAPERRPDQIATALASDDGAAGVVLAHEPFDSEVFHRRIARVVSLIAPSPASLRFLLAALADRAAELGVVQILRRVRLGDFQEIWALENSGFEIMDVGVTFATAIRRPIPTPSFEDLEVRVATDDDMRALVPPMIERPWGSRYESDPGYAPEDIRELRSRWMWNSHRGRAQAVFVGLLEGRPAGYVICLHHGTMGEIDLVGTLPEHRGRRVAPRVLGHSMAWFSTRATTVTVRTQATNFTAATLYERAGFTLQSSDATFRLNVDGSRERVT